MSPSKTPILRSLVSEIVMSIQFQAARPSRRSTGNPLHVVAFFALLPFGFVGGMMLMQILGKWPY